jgi:hypothetical protein
LLLVAVLGWTAPGAGCAAERVYTTWAPWQVDSALAAWAIKRYVDPGAQFESVVTGTRLAADRALDTPDSVYRRTAARTAFEEVVRVHGLEFNCAARLRRIVRVLELVRWRKAENPEAEAFELALNERLPRTPQRGGLEAAFAYIESFCVSEEAEK